MSRSSFAPEPKVAPQAAVRHGAFRINVPGDTYEQEAEHTARQVLRPETRFAARSVSKLNTRHDLQRECSCEGNCDSCRRKKLLQRDASRPTLQQSAPALVDDVLRGSGRPIEPSTQVLMESRFGYNFGGVRIFDDAIAAASAAAISANAYTVGRKIVFNHGRYAPNSSAGQRLLAHELTHVVQQEEWPATLNPSAGHPLQAGLRAEMEQRFGQDFRAVKIHTESAAARSAAAAGAGAYAEGEQIAFGDGFYQPNTQGGRTIVAHELAHVLQQRRSAPAGSRPDKAVESEALAAGETFRRTAQPISVSRAAPRGPAAMSIAEARRALWSKVPENVKEYVRPIAQEAAAQMDKVVPPTAQLPRPVENLVTHPIETLTAAAEKTVQTAKEVGNKAVEAKDAVVKAAAVLPQVVKAKVKQKVHDTVLGALGSAKGVALEATNIVDTLAWLPHAAHELEKGVLGNGATANIIVTATDSITGYAALNYLAKAGYGAKDPMTGQPTGVFAVSETLSAFVDNQEEKLEALTGDGKPQSGLLFTAYEESELTGAVGTQVALGAVGVEEVQVALKAVGAIGSVKSVFEAVDHNPGGFYKDVNFWSGVIMMVLTILGLGAAKASRKITGILMAGTGLAGIVPLIWNLYKDYKELPAGAKRDKQLRGDFAAILKALSGLILSLVQHGTSKGKGAPTEEPVVKPSTSPESVTNTSPVAEAQAPRPSSTAPESIPAAASTKVAQVTTELPPQAAEAAVSIRETTPESAPAKSTSAPEKIPAAAHAEPESTTAKPKAAAAVPAMEPETSASPKQVNKEEAVARSAVKGTGAPEEHEVIATKRGLGRCSASPCPAISVVYREDLVANKGFAERYKEIRTLGETNPQAATNKAAELVHDIESARRSNATSRAAEPQPELRSRSQPIEIDTTAPETPFVVERNATPQPEQSHVADDRAIPLSTAKTKRLQLTGVTYEPEPLPPGVAKPKRAKAGGDRLRTEAKGALAATREEQLAGIRLREEVEHVREASPSTPAKRDTKARTDTPKVTVGEPDPAFPQHLVTQVEADHLVPLAKIYTRPGAAQLSVAQLTELGNLRKNLVPASKRVNGKRQDMSYREWSQTPEGKTADPAFVKTMIAAEDHAITIVDAEIQRMVQENTQAEWNRNHPADNAIPLSSDPQHE